jgi:SAM-dependent methyltransferase
MLNRRDQNLKVVGDVIMAKYVRLDELWRGLDLGAGAAFTIPDVRRFVNFRAFPAHCGWMVETTGDLEVRVAFVDSESGEECSSRTYSGAFQPLMLPWPHAISGALDLKVSVPGNGKGKPKGKVFIANHRALTRDWLLDAAVGTGIEIGPGPQPQILPKDGVDVSFLEQMPPEEWNRLYNGGGKFPVRPELWKNYIIGEASALPVADGSLDFIFGSHVFEHLANPIGHLRRWKDKLAPGGKVICVVPDLGGTKDAVQDRSTIEEWRGEDEADLWLPVEKHYVRHMRRPADDEIVREAMNRNESIHVHYYDNINAQQLLDLAVKELGYADYVIEHTPNHKDFYFVLRNR